MQTADKTPIFLAFLVSFGLQSSIARAQVPIAPTSHVANAIGATTEDPAALRKSAQAAMQAKDWSKAIYSYRKLTILFPKKSDGWNGLCWAQLLMNQPQLARPDCEKTVELEPHNYAALVNLGHTFLLQNDTEIAQTWYKKSLRNIATKAELNDGPLSDFDIFIANAWRIEASRQAKAWFEKQGAERLAQLALVDALLYEAKAKEAIEEFAVSYQLRERILKNLTSLFGETHARVHEAKSALNETGGELAVQLVAQGKIASNRKDFATAYELLSRSLRLMIAYLGNEHRVVTAIRKELGIYAGGWAIQLFDEATVAGDRDEFARVNLLFDRSLALAIEYAGPESDLEKGFRQAIANKSLNWCAQLLKRSKNSRLDVDFGQVMSLIEKALLVTSVVDGPSDSILLDLLARSRELFAFQLYDEAKYEDALALQERVLGLYTRIYGPVSREMAGGNLFIAQALVTVGKYAEALDRYEQAFAVFAKLDGPESSNSITVMYEQASLFSHLGREAEALALFQKVLFISEKAISGAADPTSLVRLGAIYEHLGRHTESVSAYESALAISQRSDSDGESTASTLSSLSRAYGKSGRVGEAIGFAEKALKIVEAKYGLDHPNAAYQLLGLSQQYLANGRPIEAELLLLRTWRIANTGGDPGLSWTIQAGLRAFYSTTNPELAIWYGKQAVNTLQQVRSSNTALNKETQKSFLQKNENSYKSLADLLFAQGRLLEGQQVLAMLKEAEYFDFVQRSSASDPRKTQADYTEQERPWSERYSAISSQLAAMSKEYDALIKKAKNEGSLNTADQQRKDKLDADLTVARQAFNTFMVELKREFTQGASAQRQQDFGEKNLTSLRALQGTLRDLSKLGNSSTATLHYLMTDKRLWILLTTPTIQLKREAAISEADLNRQIGQYRQAIASRDPKVKELGKALYDILIAPVAQDLQQAQAKTLMLSLDGSLLYLPMAALYDGEQYLAQRYRLAIYTEAAKDKLKDQPQTTWSLAGYGLTQKIEHFDALPSVKGELSGILQDMKGSIKLDNDFTAQAFKTGLEAEPPVIHLASHFVFKPGNETDSFLLMGDGKRLSLKDIKDGYTFTNTDLLTLSACETAVGGGKDANGREVEGFGALAQNQGAKGVIATLWPVADQSTGQFMQLFYGYRQQNPGMTKAQAMQMAQKAFIEGKVQTSLEQVRRGAQPVGGGSAKVTAVTTTDHPYYWAPFILMGNWL